MDREIGGQPIVIANTPFAHGVGTHAASRFRVDLGGHASRFTARVGVDDSAGGKGSVEFIVSGDGKVLWQSGRMTGGQPAKPVDVDLTGVKTLGLQVTDGDDGSSDDHADWADAKITVPEDSQSQPVALAPYEKFSIQSKTFELNFQVGDDGRLYQQAIGGGSSGDGKLLRASEAYPQAGDGYIWDPALQIVHADGNTSTALQYDGVSRSHDDTGRELVRVQLHDPAYPLEVVLCFRVDADRDVIEQWAEITHHESAPIILEHMASSALLLSTNVCLTHFFGDWAKEMLAPITEPITPGTKILDSKIGVRADQFNNPSFGYRWMARRKRIAAACWPVHWNGRAVSNARLMTTRKAFALSAA